jgi:16S rRNA (guanine527-N7)-methyltransferase
MRPPEVERTLAEAARALDAPLTEDQIGALRDYLALLERWNRVYNLTAVREPAQMLVQHLLDSLAVVAPLRRWSGGRAVRVLDVGSGGGLPGVVLGIAMPEVAVTCVEAVGKKAAFVQQVVAELGLRNVQARHARVERLARPGFDVVTSRAFASLSDFFALTRELLAPGGVWMAMKGQRPDAEIAALPADVEMFHVEPIAVPQLHAERCLVWMRPRSPA